MHSYELSTQGILVIQCEQCLTTRVIFISFKIKSEFILMLSCFLFKFAIFIWISYPICVAEKWIY